MTGLTRDGHLTDLALEHLLAASPLPGTEAHLTDCGACRARLEAARDVELPQLDLGFRSAPPALQAPEPANRPWTWAVLGAIAAAVAVIALAPATAWIAFGPGSGATGDGFHVKGNGVGLQVFRDGGTSSERLRDGDAIRPGDRLGFRLRSREAGHLLVFGIDAADETYLCYPQDGGGTSAAIEARPRPSPLPEAIRMDDTPGQERLIAVVCDTPFALDDMADAVRDGRAPAGCAFDDVTLEKR